MLIRLTWAALGIVLVAFGTVGVLVIPLGLVVFSGLLGLAAAFAVWQAANTFSPVHRLAERRKPDVWAATAAMLAFVLVCLAIVGLVTVVDTAMAMALLAVVVSAWLGRRLWRGAYAERAVAVTAPVRPPTTLRTPPNRRSRDLPTDELCLVWRRSYCQLQRAADEGTRQQIIRARQECLDELERRDRPGFTRWLASGARAGSDPRRYLSPGG